MVARREGTRGEKIEIQCRRRVCARDENMNGESVS